MEVTNEMDWLDILRGYYFNYLESKNIEYIEAFNPLYIGYKITERCNQLCRHCWAGKSAKDNSYEKIIESIDKIAYFKPYMFGISGGEPFMHENIISIVEYCTKIFPCVEILTNAELLNDGQIQLLGKIMRKEDFLQISMDGLRENYSIQRGKDSFGKVVENISKLVDQGITVRLHMTVTDTNIDDMMNVYNLSNDLGVNTFSVTYVYPLRKGKDIWDLDDIYKYESNVAEIEKVHNKSNNKIHFSYFLPIEIQSKKAKVVDNVNCIVPNFDVFHWTIDANGDMYNYMDYYENEFLKIGNIYDNSIEEIDSKNQILQNKLLYRDLTNTKCQQCSILSDCMGGSFIDNYPDINLPDRRCLFDAKH